MRLKVAALTLSLALSVSLGCKKEEPPPPQSTVTHKTVPLVPRPDAPPKTAYGTLESADRVPTTSALTLCNKGRCKITATAHEGNTFVIVNYDGPASAQIDSTTFTSLDAKGPKFLMEEKARLEDDGGMFWSEGFLMLDKGKRSIAYEIPTESKSLTWYDGKRYFQLEPYPAERKR
jgi:hypothetical protein